MDGRRLRRTAAAGGAVALAVLALSSVRPPLSTRAYVSPPRGVRVLIQEAPPDCSIGSCYTPADVNIASGATVTWFNNTAAQHTITRCTPAACDGSGAGDGRDAFSDSGGFGNGASYFFTFASPGRYLYYCTQYGYRVMHASITVHDSGPRSTPTPAQPFGVPLPAFPPLPYIPVPVPGVGAGHPQSAAHGVWHS